jgi:hypothetical protein
MRALARATFAFAATRFAGVELLHAAIFAALARLEAATAVLVRVLVGVDVHTGDSKEEGQDEDKEKFRIIHLKCLFSFGKCHLFRV